MAAVCGLLCGACGPGFVLGAPSSRALERGVEDSLNATSSFEVTGSYSEAGTRWAIDLQRNRSGAMHVVLNGGGTNQFEATVVGGSTYFRGQQFLRAHLGTDPQSQSIAAAAGNAWWKSASVSVPSMPDLLDGAPFRIAFLGSAASTRADHVAIDGIDTVELSGQRADVYVAEAAPYRLVHLHLQKGVVVDGVGEADFHYGSYDQTFTIAAPSDVDVIDFSNLSTLPPIYTVLSVDTSACGSPCVVSAQLKNLGGLSGARAPSTVTFTMTDAGSGAVIGACTATVSRDVGYNATTTVSCTIPTTTGLQSAAIVNAAATNPGRG